MPSVSFLAPLPWFFAWSLVAGELGSFVDGPDADMAPKKGETKAAGPAKTPRIVARSAELEAKFKRMEELKAKFAGLAKL